MGRLFMLVVVLFAVGCTQNRGWQFQVGIHPVSAIRDVVVLDDTDKPQARSEFSTRPTN